MMRQAYKQVPYGVSDFITVVTQNLYYVDKTMYIPQLEEEARFLFFTRPRRFGKSLFINMLRAYYDSSKKKDFQTLFGNLWIGKHSTPLQGAFQVLYLDFSQVGGSIDVVEERFNEYCCICLNDFMDSYGDAYPENMRRDFYESKSAGAKLAMLDKKAKAIGLPLYLIIDEYDNFTNTILNEKGEAVYHAITHADGFYRDFFKKFKGMFQRIFVTGVSPVTLNDVTSGFNIGWNISVKAEYNEMLGFSTEDVRVMFNYYKEIGKMPAGCDVESMINEMKPWYDNYCFAEGSLKNKNRVFNSDMVLYFLRNVMSTGQAPKQMIDPNTMTDYGKMKQLLQFDKLDGDRKGMIREIAEKGQIVTPLFESFSAFQIPDPDIFPSLLFYYGMLTFKDTRGEYVVLGIPNNNVRRQYYGYLLEEYQAVSPVNTLDLGKGFYEMAYEGVWHRCLQFMADAYAKVSSVRDGIEAERNLQGFFMAYLNLTNYYYTAPELELNHGYCDFFLLPDLTHYKTKHSYILELKMLPKGASDAAARKQWEEAVEQINRYAEAPRVEALRQGTTLHKIIMQFDGYTLKRMEEV